MFAKPLFTGITGKLKKTGVSQIKKISI